MGRSQAPDEPGEQTPAVAPPSAGGRGEMFVELVSYMERSIHEAAHVFPAVDHLARHPSRPTAAELERLEALLSTEASRELRAEFDDWCAREREFMEAAAQLREMHGREAESEYQSELNREIEILQAKRAGLMHATENLRAAIVHDLDG